MSDETENRRALPGDFGSRVAHEIRGPLNLLAGALPELANADPEAREKLLELAGRGVTKLGRLADRLSLFSRIEAGTLRVEQRERTDLCSVAEGASERARTLMGRRRVAITVASSDPCLVDGDFGLLELAVQELVENALRHARTDVQVRVQCDAGTAWVEVTDDGRGISPSEAETIFSAHGGASRGGLHLGLSIARTIARAHGGDVELDGSLPGERTTFVLRLPQG